MCMLSSPFTQLAGRQRTYTDQTYKSYTFMYFLHRVLLMFFLTYTQETPKRKQNIYQIVAINLPQRLLRCTDCNLKVQFILSYQKLISHMWQNLFPNV